VSNPNIFQSLLLGGRQVLLGARKSAESSKAASEAYPSVLNIASPYKTELASRGVSFKETPLQAVGAMAARIATDITNDGTRGVYWRYNHPLAILEKGIEKTIGKETYKELGPLKTGLIGSAVALPVTALAGNYDITNVGEMFRPKGYTQNYAEEGSEDRRQTTQPGLELFERFFLGRSGRPLKYETAKEDIPDLTPERYGRFMRDYYQDKGLMGLVKVTPENLQGVPEVRVLGYPVNIASATTAAVGLAGTAAAIRTAPGPKQAFRRGVVGAGLGSATGAVIGTAINEAIAQGNRPRLPTLVEYQQDMQ
jgi:hypothetical protein